MTPGYERTTDRKEWATPWAIVDAASRRWGPFDLDAAATPWTAKAPRYFSLWERSPRSGAAILDPGGPWIEDGLHEPWFGRVWLNPPYGRDIELWLDKAAQEVAEGRAERVVFLLPARTDTRWFHRHALRFDRLVRFLPGRITFEGAPAPAPFPSMFLVVE